MEIRYDIKSLSPLKLVCDDTTNVYIQLWDIVQNKNILGELLGFLTPLQSPVTVYINNLALGCLSLDLFYKNMNHYQVDLRFGCLSKNNREEVETAPMICLTNDDEQYQEYEIINAMDCLYITPTNIKNIGGYNIHSKLN